MNPKIILEMLILVREKVHYLLNKYILQRFKSPFIISFVGPEGAGKSTIIKSLSSEIRLSDNIIYLGENINKVKYKYKLMEHLYKKKATNRFSNTLFTILFPFELFSRYLSIRIKLNNKIIIFDRYPLRKTGNRIICIWYNYLIKLFIPIPQILFLLDGDPVEIWRRKKKSNYNIFLKEYYKGHDLFKNINSQERFIIDVVKENESNSAENVCKVIFTSEIFYKYLNKIDKHYLKFGTCWWLTKKYHYKFFLSFKSLQEYKKIIEIYNYTQESSLKNYLPDFEIHGNNLVITKKYSSFSIYSHQQLNKLVEYFKIVSDTTRSVVTNYWTLVDDIYFKKLYSNNEYYLKCKENLNNNYIETTFAHRDFHENNIMWDNDTSQIKIIDLSDAKFQSYFGFDILNLIIFYESQLQNSSWLQVIESIVKNGIKILSGENKYKILLSKCNLEISNAVLSAYILDQIIVDFSKMSDNEIKIKKIKYDTYLKQAAIIINQT